MSGRILCIEDEADLLDSLEECLTDLGYEVITAKNGVEAIVHIRQNVPLDLILCDINMPEMNGYDVLKIVRSEASYTTIPFIFLTALNQKDNMIQALQLGCDEYIRKPVDLDILENLVKTRIARKESERVFFEHNHHTFQQLILHSLSTEMMEPTNAIILTASHISQRLRSFEDEMLSRRFQQLYQHSARQTAMLQQLTNLYSDSQGGENNIADYICPVTEIMNHTQRLMEAQGATHPLQCDIQDGVALRCDPFLISKALANIYRYALAEQNLGSPRIIMSQTPSTLEWLICDDVNLMHDAGRLEPIKINNFDDVYDYRRYFSGRIMATMFLLHVCRCHGASVEIVPNHQNTLLIYKLSFPLSRAEVQKKAG